MNLNTIAIVYVASLALTISLHAFHVAEASTGFTIDLIHRDSLHPLMERLTNAINRSLNYVKTLKQESNFEQLTSDIISGRGEYLMKFSLGTPPVETLAIADTGSDLTWIQCKPCTDCFNQSAPLFDPTQSSTYKPVPCSSNSCTSLRRTSCIDATCRYTMVYGDRSYSQGDLATETVQLGPTATYPNLIVGCGRHDQGNFLGETTGIVGLGGGKVSLTTQIGSSIQGKFSYCLVPPDATQNTSKINFGDNAAVSGAGVVTTPLVQQYPDTYYYLTLEGMTVGNQRLEFLSLDASSSSLATEGNIVIDSGTTLTIIPGEFYEQVETAVRNQVEGTIINDPQGLLHLCYLSEGSSVLNVPDIIAHFKGGDVLLKPVNTFAKTSESSMCLAIIPNNDIAIYGNLAQINFLVGYDLVKRTVSFKPTDCTQV